MNSQRDQLPVQWFDSSVGEALHRYHRGHGFESRSSLNFFSGYNEQSCLYMFLCSSDMIFDTVLYELIRSSGAYPENSKRGDRVWEWKLPFSGSCSNKVTLTFQKHFENTRIKRGASAPSAPPLNPPMEFKQTTTAGAATAAWNGLERVRLGGMPNFSKAKYKMSEIWAKEFKRHTV